MKSNVDLTESRIFTTPDKPTGLYKLFLDTLKVTKPWDFEHIPQLITSDEDLLGFNSRSIFAVGNKKERQNWKRNHAYYTGQICEYCGQNRSKKPWVTNTCNCYSMSYMRKIPWKF